MSKSPEALTPITNSCDAQKNRSALSGLTFKKRCGTQGQESTTMSAYYDAIRELGVCQMFKPNYLYYSVTGKIDEYDKEMAKYRPGEQKLKNNQLREKLKACGAGICSGKDPARLP